MRAIVLAALAAALTAVGIALAASPAVTPPTITSQPANPTNQTSASFKYSDSQAGVSFQCQLDGAGYAACPASGVTYAGPLAPGSHTFKVQAVSGTKTSTAASYTWAIDTTAPTTTLAFPGNGGIYSATTWSAGCASGPGLCGKAKDARGISSVVVSIEQGTGKWWGGSSFNQTSETFNAATLEAPGADTTAWSYPLSAPAAGGYTVHVRATDQAGNTTSASSQSAATFTIQTAAPPAPTITSGPEEETGSKSATFVFSDSQSGVTFVCAKDGGSFSVCTSPKTYSAVSQGLHTFSVEARDVAGNVSPAASFSWTVVKAFTITGSLSGALAPGVTQPLPLTVENPNGKKMFVTSLTVSVRAGSTKPGCDGPTNLQVTQSNVSEANTFAVPAKGKVTIPVGAISAPQVLMMDLPTNQDACKGATFTFSYSGSGHS